MAHRPASGAPGGYKFKGVQFLSFIGAPQDQHVSNVENIVARHFLHSIHILPSPLGARRPFESSSYMMRGRSAGYINRRA